MIKTANHIVYAESHQGRIHGLKSGGRIMASARNEAPKAPRRVECEKGVCEKVAMPLPRFFFDF